tara:strand:- start:3277 stop:4128 length:852 start_codon:yes stop_codon:yes gene_type:complete
MKISEKITLIFLRALSRHLNRVTSTTRQRYVNWLAAFFYKCVPLRKKVAYSNIQRAFPSQNKEWVTIVLRGAYQMAIQNFIDFLSAPSSVSSTQFKIINQEILDIAISRNRGTILVTGHFGLWEKWGAWLGANSYPITGIFQRQSNKGSDQFFKELRKSYGMGHIYRRDPIEKSYKVLNDNKFLILASDQDAKDRGVIVNFFGHKTSVPKGAAIFHIKKGASLIFSVGTVAKDGEMTISFEEIILKEKPTIESVTQAYTKMLETKIKEFPDHYFWFHRKWKSK